MERVNPEPVEARRAAPIPGPSLLRLLTTVLASRGDRWEVARRLRRRYGDLLTFRLAGRDYVLCADPDATREVLIRQRRRFGKGAFYKELRRIEGAGLPVVDGEEYRRQREEVQHFFTPRRLQESAPGIIAVATNWLEQRGRSQTIDVVAEMKRLSLVNTTRSFFHIDAGSAADRILWAIDTMISASHKVHRFALPYGRWLDRLPLPSNVRLRAAQRTLDEVLYAWIDQRAAAGASSPDDVLTAVTAGVDAGTPEGRVRRREARDKLLMLLLAGVETTASAFASLWYFLGRSPEAESRLHRELDATLAGRAPAVTDLDRLPFLGQVIQETLRLHPPTASVSRMSTCPVDLKSASAQIPAHSSVGLSQWLIHQDERFFPRPQAFVPERWQETNRDPVPEGAYFPFGLGSRRCIGEHFAMLEMKLTVAVIAQRARLVVPPGSDLRLAVSTTVRPTRPLPAVVELRTG